jgi:hypothetical protein
MYFLGLDPGVNGGIAILRHGREQTPRWTNFRSVVLFSMPEVSEDIWNILERELPPKEERASKVVAALEKVGGYVGHEQPASRAFTFGASYGELRAFLIAGAIPRWEPTPQRWQRKLGIPGKKKNETKVQWKNRLRGEALKLFPGEKITLKTADALLLAVYAQQLCTGSGSYLFPPGREGEG